MGEEMMREQSSESAQRKDSKITNEKGAKRNLVECTKRRRQPDKEKASNAAMVKGVRE